MRKEKKNARLNAKKDNLDVELVENGKTALGIKHSATFSLLNPSFRRKIVFGKKAEEFLDLVTEAFPMNGVKFIVFETKKEIKRIVLEVKGHNIDEKTIESNYETEVHLFGADEEEAELFFILYLPNRLVERLRETFEQEQNSKFYLIATIDCLIDKYWNQKFYLEKDKEYKLEIDRIQ